MKELDELRRLLKALYEIDRLKEKLVQIHICAENAQYGLLDSRDAINSIAKAAELEE